MFNVEIDNQRYRIVFQHETSQTENPTLFRKNRYNGATRCAILDEERNLVAEAISRCSKTDNFVKEQGRKHAMQSLLAHTGFSKESRELIWNTYFNQLQINRERSSNNKVN
jgi:hypothetical protein